MANIFTLENIEDFNEKINIDELYEKKKQYDLNKLALFNKILNRIHVKIKTISNQKINETCCWYLVPEVIIGVPKYDQGLCIAYLIDKLKNNGFNVKYIHPNLLFICWQHWVPTYVRNEIKKKTGVVIDEYGNKIQTQDNNLEEKNPNQILFNSQSQNQTQTKTKTDNDKKNDNTKYKPIEKYKPTGNLVYNTELFNKLNNKFL